MHLFTTRNSIKLFLSIGSSLFFFCLINLIFPSYSLAITCNTKSQNTILDDFRSKSLDKKLEIIRDLSNEFYINQSPHSKQETICTFMQIINNEQELVIVRHSAIDAIGGMGSNASQLLGSSDDFLSNNLKNILKNSQNHELLRRSALENLVHIDSSLTQEEIIAALNDPDFGIRLFVLYGLTESSPEIIDKLYSLLENDQDSEVRATAIDILSKVAKDDPRLIYYLSNSLDDPAYFVRRQAANALAILANDNKINFDAKKRIIPKLEKALLDPNNTLRAKAVFALGKIGNLNDPLLQEIQTMALTDSHWRVRAYAASALGDLSLVNKKNIETLIDGLDDEDAFVREKNMEALRKLDRNLESVLQEKKISLDQVINYYKQVLTKVSNEDLGLKKDNEKDIQARIKALEFQQAIINILRNTLTNPIFDVFFAYFLIHLSVFLIKPLWLLEINTILKKFRVTIPILKIEFSGSILVFSCYSSRVLDAWLKKNIQSARDNFQAKETVERRRIHISSSVVLGEHRICDLTSEILRKKFQKHLLILGEGGSGKTSLACQIAKWAMSEKSEEWLAPYPMLPILIESELEAKTADTNPLIDAIQGQLEDLINSVNCIDKELVIQLLRRRRLLIIIDHLSEMTNITQSQIRPDLPGFFINALIATSRDENIFPSVTKTIIKPIRIEGNHIASFMESYLTHLGKRDLFTDSEFFTACSRLSVMVGKRNITPLLAKLYIEELVSAKIDATQEITLNLPNNIPDLMLCYINELNRIVQSNKLDDRLLHRDAETIAWECLKSTYSPMPARRDNTLSALGGTDAEHRLDYLEHCLHLIETISPAENYIRFALDPLAEYLAGLYLVNQYGENRTAWHHLIDDLHNTGKTSNSMAGFLIAIRDCCVAKGNEAHIPNFVTVELSQIESELV